MTMSHPAPTSCIQLPTLDTTVAIHSARNIGWPSGAHGDEAGS
jgi:hypothetical protein